jgi:predicted dehydrogenase
LAKETWFFTFVNTLLTRTILYQKLFEKIRRKRLMVKYKFAIIGCGRIAYRHIEAIYANKDAELVALCDLNIQRAHERNTDANVSVYQDYNEMLQKEDVDVVNIMTPSGMHVEHALDIINKYKKHMVIEKPMCLNIRDGIELIETAKNHNIQVFVVHQNRFNKAVQKIKSAIELQQIGRIALATVRLRWSRGQNYYERDPWRGIWALDGGVLTNQAIHHIDILRWLIGDVKSVSAIGATQFVDIEVEDTACVWLRFQNGTLGIIEATNTVRPEYTDLEASVSMLAEKGTLVVEGTSINKLTTWTCEEIDIAEFSEEHPNVYGFGHNHIINNVVDTLKKGHKPLVRAEDALESIKLLSAIYKSMEDGGKEVFLKDNPVSTRLGIIDEKSSKTADLYRTDIVLKRDYSGKK